MSECPDVTCYKRNLEVILKRAKDIIKMIKRD